MEGLVSTRKVTDRAGHTHVLEAVEGGTCQDKERNGPSEAHSQTGDSRGRDFVRTRKETDLVRGMGTHILENAERRPSHYRDSV